MISKKSVLKKIIAVSLISCMTVFPVVTESAAAAPNAAITASAASTGVTVTDNSMYNEYIRMVVSDDSSGEDAGRFLLGTTGGNPEITTDDNSIILYGLRSSQDNRFDTSFTSFRIDGESIKYADDGLSQAHTFDVESKSCTSKQTIGNITITQVVSIINNSATNRDDVFEIKYIVENNDSADHSVGTRIMLDTMLGSNDNAPFRVEGIGNVTTETELTGDDVPQYWQAFDDLEDPGVVAQGTFYKSGDLKPDKVQFCNWGRVDDTLWDYQTTSGRSNGDSAVTATWNERTIPAGESRVYKTYYGLSEITSDQVASLAFSVYSDSTASVNQNGYVAHPVTSYIKNTGDTTVENAYVKIVLPQGFSLSSGSQQYTYTSLAVNEEKQIDWKVKIPNGTAPGNYEIKVICGADNVGEKPITKTVTVPEFVYTAPLVNKSTVNAQEFNLGDSVNLTGAAEGGKGPYTYSYYFKQSENSGWTLKGTEYGSDTSASFTPSKATSYDVKINVKDSEGTVVSKLFTVKVNNSNPLDNKSTVSASSINLGDTIDIKGAAEGGKGPYTYSYYFKQEANSAWSLKGTANTKETAVSITPSKATKYDIKVIVKDSTGKTVSKTFKVDVNAASAALNNKSTVKNSSITLGNTIDITGAAEGGKGPYTYSYYFKKSSDSSWTLKGTANTTATSASVKPGTATAYDIKVDVKDSTGKVVSKTFKVNVGKAVAALDNKSTLKTTKIYLGDTIDITGAATGGKGPYTYSYYFKRSADSGWTLKGTANTSETAVSIKPSAAVKYDVKVIVKDANGKSVSKIFTVNVKTALDNKSTVNSTSVYLGDTIDIKGAASGGEGKYTYSYYFKKASASSWTLKGTENTTETSVSIKPGAATNYNIKVNVKDSEGTVVSKLFNVSVVKPNPLDNKSTVKSASINLGGTIDITGAASGGKGPYTYSYYYKKASSTKWVLKGTANTKETAASIKPSAAVVYDIKVVVKDSTGKTVSKTFKVETKEAVSVLNNKSTVNAASIILGNTIDIKGAAEGGKGSYTYSYYFKKSANSDWISKGVNTKTTSVSITPSAATSYDIKIVAKDSAGTTATKIFKVDVTKAPDALDNKSTINSSKMYLGDTITVKGAAAGGTGGYKYSYYFKKSANTEWISKGVNTSATSVTIQPTAATNYDIKVIVTDSSGKSVTVLYQVKVLS